VTTAGLDPLAAFRVDDRVAIVTGATSGLGERFARVLAAAGASVIVAGRRADRLGRLAAEIHGVAVPGDLADPDAPAALVDAALARHGRVDILVNNAGISHIESALTEPSDEYRRELAVDLVAPFELSRLVARSIIERGGAGSIVNVASVWGLVGVGQIPDAGYAAAKGGLVNLTRELAAQWARQGVRVNVIAPAFFRTEMTDERMFQDERARIWMGRRTPMGRGGEEHELDGALLFLASPASSYVTGAVVPVDGGWTAV